MSTRNSAHPGFTRVRAEPIPELRAEAAIYHHDATGAEVLALASDEPNMAFAVGFATYPEDDTGVAHILEHMVLAGSERYPVRDPFFEMLKSSPAGFLNAVTYPDRTLYPYATENRQDFSNLLGVYLDAVFHPRLTRETFEQEAWHYELERAEGPLQLRGVVFNEMKGAVADPNRALSREATAALFPDNLYRFESGGDPEAIPDLTYEQLIAFHRKHYAPSRARFVLYGDVPLKEALEQIGDYLSDAERLEPLEPPRVQPRFDAPATVDATYPAGPDGKAFATVNWAFPEVVDPAEDLALEVLGHALTATPGAPLRRALLDSGLGEAFVGGLMSYLRQPTFRAGLRGVEPQNVDEVISLVTRTLKRIAEDGLSEGDVASARNTVEFRLREMDVYGGQRGVGLAAAALGYWLHGRDPVDAVKFEDALVELDARMRRESRYLEGLLEERLVENPHRVDLRLLPDPATMGRRDAKERERLDTRFEGMSRDERESVVEATDALKAHQQAEESPEAIASLPFLRRSEVAPEPRHVPAEDHQHDGVAIRRFELDTRGIVYLDMGFDLRMLPPRLLPYASVFGRALFETGTSRRTVAELSQAIGRDTGGIHVDLFAASGVDRPDPVRFFVRAKALAAKAQTMTELLREILHDAKVTDLERIGRLAREEKARREASFIPSGHAFALRRSASHGSEAAWAREQTEGIAGFKFLERLIERIDREPGSVRNDLAQIRDALFTRAALAVGVTADGAAWRSAREPLFELIDTLDAGNDEHPRWVREDGSPREGFAIPAQVHYLGATLPLRSGSIPASWLAASRFLRSAHLLPKIRFQGGAYSAGDTLDVTSGELGFYTYRDPNLLVSLDVFAQSVGELRRAADTMPDEELEKVVVGAVGRLDPYALPASLGYRQLGRWLAGITDETTARRRRELLEAQREDFRDLADAIEAALPSMRLAVLGPEESLRKAEAERGEGWLEIDTSL